MGSPADTAKDLRAIVDAFGHGRPVPLSRMMNALTLAADQLDPPKPEVPVVLTGAA
jgi:hypothetical protein